MLTDFNDISDRSTKGTDNDITVQEGRFLVTTAKCPDCGNSMLAGPEAGCCQNIKCVNDNCASRFNVMHVGEGAMCGHRIT